MSRSFVPNLVSFVYSDPWPRETESMSKLNMNVKALYFCIYTFLYLSLVKWFTLAWRPCGVTQELHIQPTASWLSLMFFFNLCRYILNMCYIWEKKLLLIVFVAWVLWIKMCFNLLIKLLAVKVTLDSMVRKAECWKQLTAVAAS